MESDYQTLSSSSARLPLSLYNLVSPCLNFDYLEPPMAQYHNIDSVLSFLLFHPSYTLTSSACQIYTALAVVPRISQDQHLQLQPVFVASCHGIGCRWMVALLWKVNLVPNHMRLAMMRSMTHLLLSRRSRLHFDEPAQMLKHNNITPRLQADIPTTNQDQSADLVNKNE